MAEFANNAAEFAKSFGDPRRTVSQSNGRFDFTLEDSVQIEIENVYNKPEGRMVKRSGSRQEFRMRKFSLQKPQFLANSAT